MARKFFDKKRTVAEAVEAAAAGADRSPHLLSISRLADLLGRDRGTISDWIDRDGCPVVRRGGEGESTLLDPAAVFAWREQFVREKEADRYLDPAPADSGGRPKRRMTPAEMAKIEDIRIKRQTLAMKAKILVHRDIMGMAFRQANGLFRQTLMSIPQQVVRLSAGVPKSKLDEIYEKTWDLCAASLESWQVEIAAAMKVAAERALEFDEDDGLEEPEDDEDDDVV